LPSSPSRFTLPHISHILPKSLSALLSCLSLFKVYIDCSREFHLGISHMYILYFNQIVPPPLLSLSLFPYSLILQQFIIHSLYYLNIQKQHISILFTLSFYFFFDCFDAGCRMQPRLSSCCHPPLSISSELRL
jgi:hypothetical protein